MSYTTDIGTVKTIFNRKYMITEPQFIQDLPLWRDVNIALPPDDVKKIGAVLPITSTESQDGTSTNLNFNIEGLPEITGAKGTATLLQSAANFWASGDGAAAPELIDIQTKLPVSKYQTESVTVLYFDISALDYMPLTSQLYKRRKVKVKTNSYNSSRSAGPSLTATAPMVEDTHGSSATVSFDISDLNYA